MKNKEFLFVTKDEVEKEIEEILKKFEINKIFKIIILMMERIFNDLEKSPKYKEAFAEELSYLLYLKLKNEKEEINLKKLSLFDVSEELEGKNKLLNNLYYLLEVRNLLRDMEVYCLQQNYDIECKNNSYQLIHPIKDYIHFYKLGYLLNYLESSTFSMNSVIETNTLVDDILDKIKIDFPNMLNFQVKDENTIYERIEYKFHPSFLGQLYKFFTALHGSLYCNTMSKYLQNSQIDIEEKCINKGELRWIDLINFSIVMQYISSYINSTIKNNAKSNRMAYNSRIFAMENQQFKKFFIEIFQQINPKIRENEIRKIMNSFSFDIENDKERIDLQFKPIMNFGSYRIILLNSFANTDIIRAYIQNNNLQLDDQGNKFENEVYSILKKGFPNIEIFKSVKYKDKFNKKGEIDLCFKIKNNIYFIECKNPKLPISASSSTNNYLYIQKAKKQLEFAEEYFNEDKKLFLQKHLRCNINEMEDYKVFKIIVLANRNVSGLNIEDIAIRDIFSLTRLIDIGSVSSYYIDSKLNKVDIKEVSLYENNSYFQEIDFIKYISEKFIFHEEINKYLQKFTRTITYKGNNFSTFDYCINNVNKY
ncbi:NERD domain-containing protein [Aliarcobacter butzleri]|uniref:NERD domain-containing protein n=1 Tax=Aliarcobacter butzleri TaxID=28197 RepID=UPI001EDB257E|nr:NERD domain-containing protein [Aliarcobacter butzleri]MCG3660091.1 hypothetical protein [Aliarcobacter butzleri]